VLCAETHLLPPVFNTSQGKETPVPGPPAAALPPPAPGAPAADAPPALAAPALDAPAAL